MTRSTRRLDGALVTRWCGGLALSPPEHAGPEALAATPIYLTATDALYLHVIASGGQQAAIDHLAEYGPGQLDDLTSTSDEEAEHRRIIDYWDRQP